MDATYWSKVKRLFHSVLEHEPESRQAFLDVACEGQTDLRHEVEVLVAKEANVGSFLETAAMDCAAPPQTMLTTPPGAQLGPYRIVSVLGAGGMGEVYRAHDGKLGRDVAIKTLPVEFARNADRVARLRREARALASLNHPNIAAIYGFESSGKLDCLVLELVEGEILHGPLPLERTLDYAGQIAAALEAAHQKGIIHRDLKPANVKVTPEGRVKVLDFGLAKAVFWPEANPGISRDETTDLESTVVGHIVGTPGYMSPEQTRGHAVDERTDIWAFGCLAYELLTGKRAFGGTSHEETAHDVLESEPDWQTLPPKTPSRIRELLHSCLQKDPNQRPAHIAEARHIIEEVQGSLDRRRLLTERLRQPRLVVPMLALLALVSFVSTRLYQHNAHIRSIREEVIPEIPRLLDRGESKGAFRLLRRAENVVPNDPVLKRIESDSSFPIEFTTDPSGADVWVAEYNPDDHDWLHLGRTPFVTHTLPPGYYRFRIEKVGFQTIIGAGEVPRPTLEFDLDPLSAIPPDMVRVPGGTVSISGLQDVKVSKFLIDRFEVTNRQFKLFVDSGGYQKREYWKEEFIDGDRKLSWQNAVQLFHDSTGRPGPSTWTLGAYQQGYDEYPVNGVSWHEAAAYAEFAGKQLPTIYHWQQAASPGFFSDTVELSNFSGAGPARVGAYRGLGAFGTLDMAGNVKEWCWNQTGSHRYILGGAWNEPAYLFPELEAQSPWDRSPQNGIRCVRYNAPKDSEAQKPITEHVRDYNKEKPAADEVFRLYRSLYAYDPSNLDSRVESIDEDNAYWKRERVSFAAGYGNERIPGYFYMPTHASPPYQTIIYAATSLAYWSSSLQALEESWFNFIIKSGRAFFVPVVKGHYQRRYTTPVSGPNEDRDRLIAESKDFRRSIDYLASRPDVDRDRLGVYGISLCEYVPILAVGEQRLKAAALFGCGLDADRPLPEADPFNFLPHFRVPTVLLSGRLDFSYPVETSARPMFRLLGAPEKDKKLVLRDGGHALPNTETLELTRKETLDWFDRYLGPVK